MKRIATLFLAIVMLVSVMAPISAFAADERATIVLVWPRTDKTLPTEVDNVQTESAANGVIKLYSDDSSTNKWSVSYDAKNDQPYEGPNGEATPIANNSCVDGSFKAQIIPKAGLLNGWYNVYVHDSRQSGSSGGYDYIARVKSAEGMSADTVMHDSAGRKKYIHIGAYNFKGDGNEYVELVKDHNVLRISGAKFEPIDPPAQAEDVSANAVVSSSTDWETVDGGYKTNVNGAYATFAPEGGFVSSGYEVKINYTPSEKPVTVKYSVYYQDSVHDAVYSFGQGNYVDEDKAGVISLGRFPFKSEGVNKVVITKLKGEGDLVVSTVDFEAVGVIAEAAISRANLNSNILNAADSISADSFTSSWKNNAFAGWENVASFAKTPPYQRTTYANEYLRFDVSLLNSGYYDVYWYQMVDDTTKDTDDIKAFIYHDNRKTTATISNKDVASGTADWLKLGTYYFKGGHGDEQISIGGTSKKFYAAGLKFVPNAEKVYDDVLLIDSHNTKYVTGEWSTGGLAGYAAGSKMEYSNLPGQIKTFSASSLEAGDWTVGFYTKYHDAYQDDATVDFIVNHNGKMDMVTVDISKQLAVGQYGWVNIGKFDFAGTANESVSILSGFDHERAYMNNKGSLNGTSIRISTLKYTRVDEDFNHEYYVLPDKDGAGTDFKASNSASLSNWGYTANEGLYNIYTNSNNGKAFLFKYYVPSQGIPKGRYKVSINLFNVSTQNEDKDMEISIMRGAESIHDVVINVEEAVPSDKSAWVTIAENIELDGNALNTAPNAYNAEFVQVTRSAEDASKSEYYTRLGAVKFELLENYDADVEVSPRESKGVVECAAYINDGSATMVPYPYNLENADKGINELGEHIAIFAEVFNGTNEAIATPDAYAVVYTADGKSLKRVMKLDKRIEQIPAGASAYYSNYITRTHYEVGEQIKIFIWDGLKPLLTDPATMTVIEGTWAPTLIHPEYVPAQ